MPNQGSAAKSGVIENLFLPEGLLASHLTHFEYRPAQIEIAQSVARAFEEHICVLIEAGTGTGKTLAYLAPVVLFGKRAVISTGTKNLQDQLIYKDIPLLQKALNRPIHAMALKGRENYVCLRRWRSFSAHPALHWDEEDIQKITSITKWLKETKRGERTELRDFPKDTALWKEISSKSESCLAHKCPYYTECFLTRIRQQAAKAQIVVVNHHLLMADCRLRSLGFGEAIPRYHHLIIDEAHLLDEIATEYFGQMVSNYRLQELVQDIKRQMTEDKIIDDWGIGSTLDELIAHKTQFFDSIRQDDKQRDNDEKFLLNEMFASAPLQQSIDAIIKNLSQLKLQLSNLEQSPSRLFTSFCRRALEIKDALEFIRDPTDIEFCYWGERRGRGIFLNASPINVADQLPNNLFKRLKGFVLTSATMSANQNFSYICSRLGLKPDHELMLSSPFEYERQAVIYLPQDIPMPQHPEFADKICPEIERILMATSGRALILFTSFRNLKNVYHYLQTRMPHGAQKNFRLLKQGDMSSFHLIKCFRDDISSVLLATRSFWQGVDIPGESLSCLIIDRIPFAVPTEPVIAARIEWLRKRERDPFHEYQLPSAIISLKQGLGRLIRNRKDKGLFVILDRRLQTKSYGGIIVENLPSCPVVYRLDEAREKFNLL
ncbi:MAG: ATP-dependent DNA helicase [bacterium]